MPVGTRNAPPYNLVNRAFSGTRPKVLQSSVRHHRSFSSKNEPLFGVHGHLSKISLKKWKVKTTFLSITISTLWFLKVCTVVGDNLFDSIDDEDEV